jgi:hypothetical protein
MSWLPNKLAAIIANPIKGLTAIITAPITVSVSLTTSISILVPICVPILLTIEPCSTILVKFSPVSGAKDVYTKNARDRGVNGWKIEADPQDNFDSGLQIQNYRNDERPNHTVIAISGTNGLNDWDDNLSFVTGGLSE